MKASELLELAAQPEAWRRQARAMRFCAETAWGPCADLMLQNITAQPADERRHGWADFDGVKLLYGYVLEAALKAWIVEHQPGALQFEVTMNGAGEATKARIVALGDKPGHDLLALADTAGLFRDPVFAEVLTEPMRPVMRNLCRDIGEAVVWRARYPTPIVSYDPPKNDPPPKDFPWWKFHGHYMRDLLDPILDVLLATPSGSSGVRAAASSGS